MLWERLSAGVLAEAGVAHSGRLWAALGLLLCMPTALTTACLTEAISL